MAKNPNLGKRFLSNLKLHSDYYKWIDDLKRYENWEEACDSIVNGHREKYNNPELAPYLESVLDSAKSQTILASQRNLQFRAKQLEAHNARMFNCLSGDTRFITNKGTFSFEELGEGAEVGVWTHKGRWKRAVVRKYGKQKLNKIHFLQGVHGASHIVKATGNHRWILSDGSETDNLKIGDKLIKPTSIFNFVYEESNPLERLYWCFGYVYGDGTKVRDKSGETKYSMVRLCGDQTKFIDRFREMGFKDSSPLSIGEDIMVYTGKYLKELPDINVDNLELMQAFVCGYLDADGEKNNNDSEKLYNSIQTSNTDSIEFIRSVFPSCGLFISKEYDLSGQETNYGTRPTTSRFTITNSYGSKYNRGFVVSKIEEYTEEDVWCLEVDDDRSFTLSNGIVTGNCTVVHVCYPRVFQEILYLGLCGCGVGASLLLPFVNQLPRIQTRQNGTKTFVVPDNIEGWADALGILLSSYFYGANNIPFPEYSGYEIRFDYSQIREKGSYISGGFKAPGPDGLKSSLERIEKLIENWLRAEGEVIRPILAYDIICHASDAVLSGGVRRSALSMIVDPNDEEMIMAKTGTWRQTNPQRARSNNSVLIHREFFDDEEPERKSFFKKIVGVNEGDSDIGFVFCNTWFDVFNPCFTKDTKVLTVNGWKTFGEMIEAQNNGEDVYIIQDTRVKGRLDGIEEVWDTNLENYGTNVQKIGKVSKTGENVDIYKLTLSCGRYVKATGCHKFATTDGMKRLLDLVLGDKVLIAAPSKQEILRDADFYDGFLSGLCVGDGYISEDTAGINLWQNDTDEGDYELQKANIEQIFKERLLEKIDNNQIRSSGNKPLNPEIKFKLQSQVGNSIKHTLCSTGFKKYLDFLGVYKDDLNWIHGKSLNFKAGLISGLFFCDGHVDYAQSSKSISLRITQSNKELLNNIQLVLQELGFISSVYNLIDEGLRKLPNSNREYVDYYCQKSYRLVVAGVNQVKEMVDDILFLCSDKINKCNDILNTLTGNRDVAKYKRVINVEHLGKDDVYCLEENQNRTLIANGITSARCFEIGFTPVDTYEDLSKIEYDDLFDWTRRNLDLFGIQACNLNEINAEKCQTKDQFLKACHAASVLGTLQAGYHNFPYLGSRTESLIRREALLGVSITGWMNNPKLLNPQWLTEGAEVVVNTNKMIAEMIGINQAARTTCVKPSGNSSVILGTASGVHPEHSYRYFRIMQLNKESDAAKWLDENMPFLLEESVWSSSKTDYVVFVPITNTKEGLFKKDMKGIKHLEIIKMIQQNWVVPGTVTELGICDKTLHNVSCTVIIDNKDDIINYIWDNRRDFTAVSFISDYGDKDFNQAPFTSVLTPDEIFEHYGTASIFVSGLIVDALHYFDNNLWQACDTVLNPEIPITGDRAQVMLRKYWVKRAKKFAKNYFKNDLTAMVYCLKDVHLLHKWETISRQMKDVDFGEILSRPEYKSVSEFGSMACSGPDGCTITRL